MLLEGARVPERGALAPKGCLPQTGRGYGQARFRLSQPHPLIPPLENVGAGLGHT